MSAEPTKATPGLARHYLRYSTANVLVMTVSLDLDINKTNEAKAINALKSCASDSRFRKDPADPSKPAKLFWNATGSNLAEKFKEIADELSNLRIVG